MFFCLFVCLSLWLPVGSITRWNVTVISVGKETIVLWHSGDLLSISGLAVCSKPKAKGLNAVRLGIFLFFTTHITTTAWSRLMFPWYCAALIKRTFCTDEYQQIKSFYSPDWCKTTWLLKLDRLWFCRASTLHCGFVALCPWQNFTMAPLCFLPCNFHMYLSYTCLYYLFMHFWDPPRNSWLAFPL